MRIGVLMQEGVPDVRRQPRSGPALHVTSVCRAFLAQGEDVRLLARIDGRIWMTHDLGEFTPVRVRGWDEGALRVVERIVRRGQSALRLPWAAFFDSARFAAACCQELSDRDLFYERMGWMGYGGVLASRRMHVPLVLEVNGDHLSELERLGIAPRGAQRAIGKALTGYAARRATHVVATGDAWRRRFLERWKTVPERVSVVENGTDMVSLLDRSQLRSFRQSGAAPDCVRLVYVGAFQPWHGVPVLIRALATVRERKPHARLTLVGAGVEEETIRRCIVDLGLSDAVTLCGYLDRTGTAMRLADSDIGVSPIFGRAEYSALKIADYKGAGLATIASGENGEPRMLTHARNGWIVPPGNPDALATAILHLVENGELARQLGRTARLEAEEQHTWAHTAERLREIFSRVAAA